MDAPTEATKTCVKFRDSIKELREKEFLFGWVSAGIRP
jgi:hypothetical protein